MKQVTRITLSLLVTAGFFYLFLRNFDPAMAWKSLQGASFALIAISIPVNLAAYIVRAWRWRVLLAPVRPGIGMYNLTSTTLIGFMISFVVPLRAGEVVRPVLLARRERMSASATLATIAVERLLDAATVMFLFLVFMFTTQGAAVLSGTAGSGNEVSQLLRRGLAAAALLVGAGIPLVALLVVFQKQVLSLLAALVPGGRTGRLAAGFALLERFLTGLGALRRFRVLAVAVLLSIGMWLAIDLSVYLGLRAFGLSLGFFDTFLLMVPLAIGIAVPTPGGVGSYEYLCQIALAEFWGVPAAVGAAVAVTLHAATMLPVILIGLVFMWRDGVRPREVRSLSETGELQAGPVEVP